MAEYQIPMTLLSGTQAIPQFTNVRVLNWADPPNAALGLPSRLNPLPGASHKMYAASSHYEANATGGWLQVVCVMPGSIAAPKDSDLFGNIFQAWWVDTPIVGMTAPILQPYADRSGIINVLAPYPGHYTLGINHQDGGGVLVHFDRVNA